MLARVIFGRIAAIWVYPHAFADDDRYCVYTIVRSSPKAPLPVGSLLYIRSTLGQEDCYDYSHIRPAFGVVYKVRLDTSPREAGLPSPAANTTFAAAKITRQEAIECFRGRLSYLFPPRCDLEELPSGVVQAANPQFLARFRVEPDEVRVADIKSLARVADGLDRKCRLFFSFTVPFSPAAIVTANDENVALLRVHLNGWVTPENVKAKELFEKRDQLSGFSRSDLKIIPLVILFVSVYLGLILGPWVVFGLAPVRTARASDVYNWAGGLGAFCLVYMFVVLLGRSLSRFEPRVPGLLKVTVSLSGVVASFAAVYLQLNHSKPCCFDPALTGKLDALYFTLTTLTTVGYGPKPNCPASQDVVMGQLVATLVIVAVGLGILSSRIASWERR
jgi:hypothetical protein